MKAETPSVQRVRTLQFVFTASAFLAFSVLMALLKAAWGWFVAAFLLAALPAWWASRWRKKRGYVEKKSDDPRWTRWERLSATVMMLGFVFYLLGERKEIYWLVLFALGSVADVYVQFKGRRWVKTKEPMKKDGRVWEQLPPKA